MTSPRLIIGISGASGLIYAQALLEILAQTPVETHVVMSHAASYAQAAELDTKRDALLKAADHYYPINDIGASIASGSFKTMGMIVAPCSMHSLAEIALGLSSNLLTRAADVILKERRRLVLMVRETPFHEQHLNHMLTVTKLGGIIAPPLPAFYTRPQSIDEMVRQSVARVLDLFDIDTPHLKRWQSLKEIDCKIAE
jgi:flavin prenyltransferase